ncbi:hypothetical protein [Tumebacillus permanentifrigoris]|uniref:Uncharacterized protein n=1 Tax=Tumebacillus permanentifrigoris TaxID=378543 RepID=A0A316D9T5_9BACL|nr:hypothetical protein [Tumebacillus permanentifrigoris]PWK13955.1 hypothetical protein C7459_106252 [Tumebacillus permanentifrigoris]
MSKIEAQTSGGAVEACFVGEVLHIHVNGQLRTTMAFDGPRTVTVNHHSVEIAGTGV